MDNYWKIKRDSYYLNTYKKFGSDKIIEAGFFYDADKVDRSVTDSVNILCTPLHKVEVNFAQYKASKPSPNGQCVLLSTGSFCPIHEGHTLIMGQARSELEKQGYAVIGGYISPGHDEYISSKNGSEAMPVHYRNRAIHEMLKKSDWLSLDPWEGTFNKVAINFTDVIIRLEAYLEKHLSAHIPVFFVCGGDNAKFALTFIDKGNCVVINRPGYEDRFEKYKNIIQTGIIDGVNCDINGKIFWSYGGNSLSSTGIRKSKKFELDVKKNLILRVEERSPLESLVKEMLGNNFSGINEKKLSGQRKQFSEDISNFPVISLDALTKTEQNLQLSRCYDLFGIDFIDYSNRPGTVSLAEQVEKMTGDKEYYLFDDDIHTGGTMRFAKSLLKDRVKIKGVFSFSISSSDEGEILDCRDFIINDNPNSGLVIELPNGKIVRAPYLFPYVCPFHRGSIENPLQFSINMWKLNADFFESKEDTLSQYQNWLELFTYVGFTPDDKMASICKWHYDMLSNFYK